MRYSSLMIPILILAAGSSSRMRGRDKLMEIVDGTPLLTRQINMALAVSNDVRVALPPRPHPRYELVDPTAARPIEVADAAEGMGASLRTLFRTLPDGTRNAMVLLADLPELQATDLQAVIDGVAVAPRALIWRGSTDNCEGGHPMIVDRALFPEFCDLTGDSGGNRIIAKHADDVHLVRLGPRARLDLDTPEDWAAWRGATSDD
ncbi:MAG: nucleotidyltransferase family protein [Pseudomonadota bacterium]